MKTYYIHLIRHGLTQANLDGTYAGHEDVDLLPEGIEELKQLKEQYIYPEVPVVFSSPLQRARQSASILFPDNEILILEDLIEYNFGEFEGLTAEQLKDNKHFREWFYGDGSVPALHGESNQEFALRVGAAFEKIVGGLLKTGITEAAVITHGGVIMTLMNMYAIPEAPMTDWLLENGAGYTLRLTPSLWSQIRKVEAIAKLPLVPDIEDDKEAN